MVTVVQMLKYIYRCLLPTRKAVVKSGIVEIRLQEAFCVDISAANLVEYMLSGS